MTEQTFKIEGMSSQHCKKNVENTLSNLKGIQSFKVKLEEGQALISFDEKQIEIEKIIAAFKDTSYQVS